MNHKYTVALALGLLLNGGWAHAVQEYGGAPPVTATVTDDGGGTVTSSHDWVVHATFRGAGRTIELTSEDRFSDAEACGEFLRSVRVRSAFMLLLAEMKAVDPESHLIAECVQLGIPA